MCGFGTFRGSLCGVADRHGELGGGRGQHHFFGTQIEDLIFGSKI
jgi:hypothetical protein